MDWHERLFTPNFSKQAELDEYLAAAFAREKGVKLPLGIAGMSSGITGVPLAVEGTRRRLSVVLGGTAIGCMDHLAEIDAQPSEASRIECYQDWNVQTAKQKVQEVREKSPFGVIGVNCLAAAPDTQRIAEALCKQGEINFLTVGAGLAKWLPQLMRDYPKLYYILITSSKRAADLMWQFGGETGRKPSAWYFEDPKGRNNGNGAGGHLGAKDKYEALGVPPPNATPEQLQSFNPHKYDWEAFLGEMKDAYPHTPIGVGGGIAFERDIRSAEDTGFDFEWIGTEALLTRQSGMPIPLQEKYYLNRSGKYPVVVGDTSPAGMPSRYIELPPEERSPVTAEVVERTRGLCVRCIGNRCRYRQPGGEQTSYCIKEELMKTQQGMEGGRLFAGGLERIRRNPDFPQIYLDEQGKPRSPELDVVIDYAVYGKLPQAEKKA